MLIQALAEKSAARSTASRFTSISGLFYLAMGLTICGLPTLVPMLFFEPTFTGREEGLFRLVGWIMAVVGWFLWIGGRAGDRSFAAGGVLPRLAGSPGVDPLSISGASPATLYIFA